MNYANIVDGKVTTIMAAEPAYIATLPGTWIADPNRIASAGMSYANGVFTAIPVVIPPYKTYTYLEFLEELMLDPTSAATLLVVKNSGTATGAMVEIMMEMVKAQDGVDFNSAVSRGRLNSLVPAIFSPTVAVRIMTGI